MTEKEQNKKEKEELQKIYGAQGNQGQYGLGQYDSEGKPDPRGLQAQQIGIDPAKLKPDEPEEKKKSPHSDEQ